MEAKLAIHGESNTVEHQQMLQMSSLKQIDVSKAKIPKFFTQTKLTTLYGGRVEISDNMNSHSPNVEEAAIAKQVPVNNKKLLKDRSVINVSEFDEKHSKEKSSLENYIKKRSYIDVVSPKCETIEPPQDNDDGSDSNGFVTARTKMVCFHFDYH